MTKEPKKREQFNPAEAGFTLEADDETQAELDRIRLEHFMAREFPADKAWR